MPGVWKKALNYLGLVEDEAYEDIDDQAEETATRHAPMAVRGGERRIGGTATMTAEPVVRTIAQPRPAPASTIHKAEPRRFNDARELAERFRDGTPVIMNLQSTEDSTARRLVDFASGLVFGLDGKIEMVANRVYLLTPANVEVSAEERERLREGGFFNQL